MRPLLASFVFVALTASAAFAAPLPAVVSSDTVRPALVVNGEPFGSGRVRITDVAWLPNTDPLIAWLHVRSDAGFGAIVVRAEVDDVASFERSGGPAIRAFVRGNDVDAEASAWYLARTTDEIRPFLRGSENALFVVRNVPRPTDRAPLEKIVFAAVPAATRGRSTFPTGHAFDTRIATGGDGAIAGQINGLSQSEQAMPIPAAHPAQQH